MKIASHAIKKAKTISITEQKGVSSLKLSKELDTMRKTAWFMLHRSREAGQNYNDGDCKIDTMGHMNAMVKLVARKRITYKELTA